MVYIGAQVGRGEGKRQKITWTTIKKIKKKSSVIESFAHFLIGLLVYLESSCVSSLYILEIKPLSEVSLANMFSHMVDPYSLWWLFI